ncbi:TetR/AcrR family transcriptional regulator [Nocardiopsis sp. CC223A]|uniref:TetR/AcrR family transcriptional regulator n=1 Tax=Nocardiopsis sp. CC223A TaxID=3044051 RepID=UPI00278BF417|nr:TetR/AcrR family transcriptional regulator [Nocardiopsis sp. CC223A]
MTADADTDDHRKRSRRRGDSLVAAILAATVAELREHGYAALTMEGVAERAGAGKASLYRRWSTRGELVMDAVYALLPDPAALPDHGSLREDLLGLLRMVADHLAGPAGEALRGLMAEALPEPERIAALREHSQGRGRMMMAEVVERAARRGEIAPGPVSPWRLGTGQALLRDHFLFHQGRIEDGAIEEIVDTVLLPLFHAPPKIG